MTKAAELAKMGEVLTNSQIGGRRNLLFNGAMNVAQRSTSLTSQGAYPGGYLTVDRWKFVTNNSAGRFTVTQEAITDLPGFLNCTKLDCTTADTSIASGEYLLFSQYLEGQDLQQIKKGTSEAEKITLSFYVKGNASATYTAEIEDSDNSRYNSQEFSVTTSWNRVVLTYNADTTGAFDDDNAASLRLNLWIHSGSDFSSGTHTSNAWHTTATQRFGDNSNSFYSSTDNTFFITGVQLEVGSQATPFEHRSYGEELQLCQRYFEIMFRGSNAQNGTQKTTVGAGVWYGANQVLATMLYSPKRTQPTITQSETGALGAYGNAYFRTSTDSTPFDSITETGCRLNIESFNASGTAGDGVFAMLVNPNSSSVSIDAEL
jgi:hypothetical protein